MNELIGKLNWRGLAKKLGWVESSDWNESEETLLKILAGWQYIGPSHGGLDLFRLRAGSIKNDGSKIDPHHRYNRYVEVERERHITPDNELTRETPIGDIF